MRGRGRLLVKRCFRLAFAALVTCTFFFGQNSSSSSDSAVTGKVLAKDSKPEAGIYVSGFQILDQGKDPNALAAYPFRILAKIRSQWYPQIIELQKSIEPKRGIAVIGFEISHDGSLSKVITVESAGDSSFDAAASLAVQQSAPFAQLPETYREKALKVRMYFGYDQPASAEAPFCDGPDWGAHSATYALHYVGDGITPPKAKSSPDPEYSEEARKGKYMSVVRIAGTVDPLGSFTDLCVVQAAGSGLDEKAIETVKTWKFEPATLRGEPVAVRLNVEVSFRLY
jgi:TonB family protein